MMNLKFDYIVALTNLYGLVHKEKVVEIYNMQNEDQLEISEIESIMVNRQAELEKCFVCVDQDYFAHEAIYMFDEAELYLEQKGDKPYYIPPKNELLKYRDDLYFEQNKAYRELLDFIKKHPGCRNLNHAKDICGDIVDMSNLEIEPFEMINRLNQLGIKFNSPEKLSEAMKLIVNMMNNTRLWSNNGFTPNELSEM